MPDDRIQRAERLLSQREFETIEEKVESQGDAIRLLAGVLQDLVRELSRWEKDLRRQLPRSR